MYDMLEHGFLFLEQTQLAMAISESSWLFPLIESAHVLALVTVVGSISMIDLRLLNWTLRERDVASLSREVLPWTWGAFALAALTGGLLFISAATKYGRLLPLKLKFLLLFMAGVNMLLFHLFPYRRATEWGGAQKTRGSARIAGGISLVLWIGIVTCGRWIGFM